MSSRSYARDQRRRRRACRPHVERCEERALLSSGLGELTAPRPQDTITLKSAAASYTLTTLVSFNGANGSGPAAAPVLDAQGNLFGTTQEGGANGQGTVFELPAGSRTLTTLASFKDANGPNAQGGKNISLVDAQGNLFGTTDVNVPIANNGTVFELVAGSGTITTLAPFTLAPGSGPNGGLVRDAQGNLFGTTFSGGPSGNGTVFELAAGSGTITTFANFNGANGTEPVFGLVRDLQGNFYGLTNGGISGMGTVFELAAGSDTITTLASFNGANGLHPSSLLLDPQGNIFGTTTGGGANGQGTVFELAAGSGTITTLASFNVASNLYPFSLVRDAQGNLFGTTIEGGANGQGTIFELPAGSGTITTLVSFNGANGTSLAFLAIDARGNLFGTTLGGGAFDQGTVFELSPVVNPDSTTTTLTSSSPNNTSVFGQPVTFTATVAVVSPGTGTPTGTVTFLDGSTTLGTGTLSGGVATLTVPSTSPLIAALAVGTHSITAVYGGDTNDLPSTSTLVTQVVTPVDGPHVTNVQRFGFHAQPTILVLQFNEALDPTRAQNVANYQIVGPNGVPVAITSAVYDATAHTVTLSPKTRLDLHKVYTLTVNGTGAQGMSDPSGNLLDGANSGLPGSNFVTTVTAANLILTVPPGGPLRLKQLRREVAKIAAHELASLNHASAKTAHAVHDQGTLHVQAHHRKP